MPAHKPVLRRAALTLVIAAGAVAAGTATVYAVDAITQQPDYGWYTQDPSAASFEVRNGSQLRGLANLVNGTADTDGDGRTEPAVAFAGKTVEQTGYISLANQEFTPIGTPDHPFCGTFVGGADGEGGGMDIRRLQVTQGTSYVGLFGYCGQGSLLKDVYISDSTLLGYEPANVTLSDEGTQSVTPAAVIHDVGALVGCTEGSIEGCSSAAEVSVVSKRAATGSDPLVIVNVGGLAGTVEGSVSDCSHTADLVVTAPSLASSTQDAVVANVGGIVGTLGRMSDDGRSSSAGSISGCTNGNADSSGSFNIGSTQATLWVRTTGVGGLDRFGIQKEATSQSVGGIVGYSFGSVSYCTNWGFVNTNCVDAALYKSSDGKVHLVDASASIPPAQYVLAEDLFKRANGGAGVGGIAGSLRSDGLGLGNVSRSDAGASDAPVSVTQCFNKSAVVGLARTAGIVGSAGTYANIDGCRNGKVDAASGVGVSDDSGHVVSTRWNKPFTGGICGTTYSSISNCCNLSEVENIQTGYYTAGIVGGLFAPKGYTPECYASFNAGLVHVTSHAVQSYREAGLVGNNGGYVHDCVMRSGCVLSYDDGDAVYPNSAIGDDSWGKWSNLKFFNTVELKKSQAAAVLNLSHAQDVLTLPEQEWSYWYISGAGYPTLSSWDAPSDRIQLNAENLSVSCVEPAEYAGAAEAIPTLIATYTDPAGQKQTLVQNVDFYAVPQTGATEMTDGSTPYSASVAGIGNYSGSVQGVCKYGIGPCDLAKCGVSVSSQKYNFDACVYPQEVYVANPAGAQLDAAEFRYEIYDATVYALGAGDRTRNVVFDSEGFVSWDGGATRQPVATQHEELCADLTGVDYRLYNSSGQEIFRVTGGAPGKENGSQYVVDPLTGDCVKRMGPAYYKAAMEGVKGGGLAGYIVKVSAKDGATSVKAGSWTTGQYVIDPIDLYRDCSVESVQVDVPSADGCSSQTQTWYWSGASSTLYTLDEKGEPVANADGTLKQASIEFTGAEVEPRLQVTYTKPDGTKVTIPEDNSRGYQVLYGDPYTENEDLTYFNRDATPVAEQGSDPDLFQQLKDHEKAAVTARAASYWRFGNYVHMYFAIEPAPLSDCQVTASGTPDDTGLCTYAYKGGYGVKPKIAVKRCGNTLVAGADYAVSYENNTEPTTQEAIDAYLATGDTSGLASYTVSGLGNTVGSQTSYFIVAEGRNLAEEGVSIAPIADQPWNIGGRVQVPGGITLLKDGKEAGLVEGEDYTVEYSGNIAIGTAQVTVRGINGYTGILQRTFNIVALDVSDPANAARVGELTLAKGFKVDAIPYGLGLFCFEIWGKRVTDWSSADLTGRTQDYQKLGYNYTAVNRDTGETYSWALGQAARYTPLAPGRYDVTLDVYGDYVSNGQGSSRFAMCCGSIQTQVTVVKRQLGQCNYFDLGSFEYTGEPIEPKVKGTCAGVLDEEGNLAWTAEATEIDFDGQCTVTYEDNVDAGTARAVVTARANSKLYEGRAVVTFNIAKRDLSDATVVACDQKYTGQPVTPAVCVAVDGFQLVEGRDYTVSYVDNVKKGVATAVVTGVGSCAGSASTTFKIGSALNISTAQVDPIPDQLYTGSAVEPKPRVTYNGQLLAEGADYQLSYQANVKLNSTTNKPAVVITGLGSFKNTSLTVEFNIVEKRNLVGASMETVPDQAYTGLACQPRPKVAYAGEELIEGTDYELTWYRNVKAGAPARVEARGMGNYEGTVSVRFEIVVKSGVIANVGDGSLTAAGYARAAAEAIHGSEPAGAVLVDRRDFAAQLAAVGLCQSKGLALLLTSNGKMPASDVLYLRNGHAATVYALGVEGTGRVAQEAYVKGTLGSGVSFTAITAANASELAASVSREAGTDAVGSAVVVNPFDRERAVQAAAYAASKGLALIMTAEDGTLSEAQLESLADCSCVYAVGTAMDVDASVLSLLEERSVHCGRVLDVTAPALSDGCRADRSVVATVPAGLAAPAALLASANGAVLLLCGDGGADAASVLLKADAPAYGLVVFGPCEDGFADQLRSVMSW